jgi:hypothetical protein
LVVVGIKLIGTFLILPIHDANCSGLSIVADNITRLISLGNKTIDSSQTLPLSGSFI